MPIMFLGEFDQSYLNKKVFGTQTGACYNPKNIRADSPPPLSPLVLPHEDNRYSFPKLSDIYYDLDTPLSEWPPIFYDHVTALWKDDGIQKTLRRFHEYQLLDSAKYYLEKIDQIRAESYIPTDQDILRCRIMTTQVKGDRSGLLCEDQW